MVCYNVSGSSRNTVTIPASTQPNIGQHGMTSPLAPAMGAFPVHNNQHHSGQHHRQNPNHLQHQHHPGVHGPNAYPAGAKFNNKLVLNTHL